MTEWIIIAILGACVGSFLNVIIYRVPLGLSVISPGSRCAKCEEPLKWYHNIPMVSWMALRGKSTCCKEKISIRYPLIEFLTMFIFLAVFYKSGFHFNALVIAIVFSLLLVLSAIDYDYHAIPDSVSLSLLAISFFSKGFLNSLHDGLLVAGFMILLRYYVSFFMDKEAMGEGDVIIAAAMGALVGVKLAFFSLFVASVIGLPFAYYTKHSNKQIPFVPFLAMGVFLTYLFSDYANAYLKSIGL